VAEFVLFFRKLKTGKQWCWDISLDVPAFSTNKAPWLFCSAVKEAE
jgi:hypothetical protein